MANTATLPVSLGAWAGSSTADTDSAAVVSAWAAQRSPQAMAKDRKRLMRARRARSDVAKEADHDEFRCARRDGAFARDFALGGA